MAGEAPNTAGFVMIPCATGDAVYKWFEKGKGPSQSTTPAVQSWRDLANGHVDVSALINKAVSDSGASWEGAAGDAALTATPHWPHDAVVVGLGRGRAGGHGRGGRVPGGPRLGSPPRPRLHSARSA